MRWHRFIFSSVVSCTFLGGCQSGGPPGEVQAPPAPGVARSQKADPPPRTRPKRSSLDELPEQPADAVSGEVAARICATVNGFPIFDEEVQANAYQYQSALRDIPAEERAKKRNEIYKEILDQIIERELLIQDALLRLKKAGPQIMAKLQDAAEKEFDRRWVTNMKQGNKLKSDDQLKEMLRSQGLSFDMIRRQWTRQFIATEYLRNRVMAVLDKVGHEQIREYYDSHPEEYKVDDTVEWLDLFVSTANPKYKSPEEARATADQIATRLRNGEDFQVLSKQSNDGDSTAREGAGIGKKRGEIQPVDCEEPLFEMKLGEVGIIEISSGYHVFKLVKREFAGTKPFDRDVQKEIRSRLKGGMYEREVKTLVVNLKRKAVIEYARVSP